MSGGEIAGVAFAFAGLGAVIVGIVIMVRWDGQGRAWRGGLVTYIGALLMIVAWGFFSPEALSGVHSLAATSAAPGGVKAWT